MKYVVALKMRSFFGIMFMLGELLVDFMMEHVGLCLLFAIYGDADINIFKVRYIFAYGLTSFIFPCVFTRHVFQKRSAFDNSIFLIIIQDAPQHDNTTALADSPTGFR